MLPFTSDTRLFSLSWRDADLELPVESCWGSERLSAGFELCIDLLSPDAFIPLDAMLGQAVTLHATTSDGSRVGRSGLVRAALALGADGGFARYRIVVVPWSWLLTRGRHNRVFQEKSVIAIVEAVFADYADHAAWHWSEEVAEFLADVRPRSYCVQYRESDYTFMSRLLAEEGLGWYVEDDAAAPSGHRLRLFADSTRFPEDPLSAHANGGLGLRFHRADSQEAQDSVVAFGAQRRLSIALATGLSHDYKAARAVAASTPTALDVGGEHAPHLEAYDDAGPYAFANVYEAERAQRLLIEAAEARSETFLGRATVRSLRPGGAFDLMGSPLDALAGAVGAGDAERDRRFAVTDVLHIGINNLTGESIAGITKRLAAAELLTDDLQALATGDVIEPVRAPRRLPAEVLALAAERGYANRFEALRGHVPWRPQLEDDTGARLNARPTSPGPMSAIVVGPHGETTPNGADELWCDALGRIKVRFHWQQGDAPDDRTSCWVRVATRQAGPGMGWQWLPRIGQEVLVGFLGHDIDRPVILGALYNGRGEGGEPPTPGGAPGEACDTRAFDAATDHHPGGQANLTAGNSPAWHGAAPVPHRHPAALTGFKTKEFGGSGYNQLVFDDSDGQQRVQLKTTQHASELNLGHLVHQTDNYRGSFRGIGAELRTDAWGALRGGRGVLMSTWGLRSDSEPAGDLAPGLALLRQACTLADTLSRAAKTHQTVQLAAALGTTAAGASIGSPDHAPLAAFVHAASGMVDGGNSDQAASDAAAGNVTIDRDKLPHLAEPMLVQSARGDLGLVAGQNLQFTAGETVAFMSGADTNLAIGGKARLHTGQAIGLVAGAIRPGEGNSGIRLIAARDDIDLQAQSDELKLQAKQDLKLVSANAHIDFAAAKRIVLAVEGGASITIDGGITVACPGTITVHASKKSFSGPTSLSYDAPSFMPVDAFHRRPTLTWEGSEDPIVSRRFRMTLEDGRVIEGRTDAHGHADIVDAAHFQHVAIEVLPDEA
ncbi:MAG TPA: type VI secretion system Vgr family protein [Aromatoleum sp.]|uniref:type VI secretion system Vgr family protein n=1 Tax=Aromatoleum sp. TaxID=2307007 RepID=UPI002B474E63|nr:type VI secretion system Vgr family protein [Aromatoleum sp.]HJV25932.1 type VI secretion system Vgr family protein [Aromatoleum sp.]